MDLTDYKEYCSVIEEDDKKVFCKDLDKRAWRGILKLERNFLKFLLQQIPIEKYRSLIHSDEKAIQKEVESTILWNKFGIPTPNLIDFNKHEIKFEYLDKCSTIEDIVNKKGKDGFEIFDNFLGVYDSIRYIAKNNDNDVRLLHSDPHLKNFLFNPAKNITYPIDSAIKLNPDMTFKEIDNQMLVFTLRYISNLKLDNDLISDYVRIFKSILSNEDIDGILNQKYQIPWYLDTYCQMHEELAYRIRKRNREDPLKQYKTFFAKYNGFIKDVLME